ncbi:metal-dependent amidase/aminoacylase/carboxypeptidase [Tothia fuscella]|uniref:Metal-dependent amidase/aminoacylase/carboxypeptidase n=1 Tax=Tothia fuscella TaxID=1048955 RepID=A0A9P4NGL7_9PEZI|nr:metal-dependent amidase/aminoacylase/carboxypeptidase [Tothia fuscella]
MALDMQDIIANNRPDLAPYQDLYKWFHANPELSFQETETAAKIHSELSKLGSFDLFPRIGKTGLAAVCKNGTGKIVLLRADIDGLPVEEKTGLEYSSRKTMQDIEGNEKPVMHACGHDMHITSLLAAAHLLVKAKDQWTGTLVLVFQPAEERGAGAQAMVDDGLYLKVPVPDIVLGGHVMPYRTGTLGTRRGTMACAADTFAVTLHGRGGHASQPHRTIDPVVMAAHIIVRLQTVASRETDPSDHAVVSVGTVHAGSVENIISDVAKLSLDIRTLNPKTRDRVLNSVKRIVEAESEASNAPKPPDFVRTRTFPFLQNDEDVTAKLEKSFSEHFPTGENGYSSAALRLGGSEDFGVLATAVNRPACFWTYGGVDPDVWARADKHDRILEDIPVNHSPFFAPVIMPTLQVATDAYAVAALTWLAR